MMYVQDYDEVFPGGLIGSGGTAQGPVSQSGSFTTYWLTGDLIHPYVMNRQIFFCPSGNEGEMYSSDYGFNSSLCRDLRSYAPVRLAHVKAPAETFMFLDAGPYMCNSGNVTSPGGSFWYIPGVWIEANDPSGVGYNSAHPLGGFAREDYMHGRHNNGCNVGFADGHSKWVPGSYFHGHLEQWTP